MCLRFVFRGSASGSWRSPGKALLGGLALAVCSSTAYPQTPEYRGFWVYSWNSDLLSASGVSTIVSQTRAGNMNVIVPQIRRRGDALYKSHYEPKCHSLTTSFDPLGDLVAKAHDTASGARLEVYPWLVTFHVWKSSTTYPLPPQPDHPVNLHPDWLLQDNTGNTLIGGEYTFDPGHPEVQEHTFNVAMDIITNYDVDGLNFDYIRYSSINEGYNPVAVARFNRLNGRTGVPSPSDTVWKQFRRDQVTALLRKIYLSAVAIKPNIKISCDTITWAPAPTSDSTWYSSSAAWNNVFQDWRGWMEEGIMDLNIPMTYFRQPSYGATYTNWSNFAKDHRFNRHVVIGPGIYLNTLSDSIRQYRQTRQPTVVGNRANGVLGYVYHQVSSDFQPCSVFLSALTSPGNYDSVSPAMFELATSVPDMPWKSSPTKGHLKGMVVNEGGELLDGAFINVIGPVSTGRISDATGFYGFVDLPPGSYSVAAQFQGCEPMTNSCVITVGTVTTLNVRLPTSRPPVIASQPLDAVVKAGSEALFNVTVSGSSPLSYQWRFFGTNRPGATLATLRIPAVQYPDAGPYSMWVTNSVGTALSSNALLSVILPPAEFTTVELTNGMPLLRGTGEPGPCYLEWSTDLALWFPLTNVLSTSNGFYHLDTEATNQQRFYRVHREP
jgi:uncharacterized lipoprotein YddW (UPF0748 family)